MKQTFYSREYLVPLLILSALTLVGWYSSSPRTMNGLVDLLESGASVTALTNQLTQFTPLTMAFAGAWLFMTVRFSPTAGSTTTFTRAPTFTRRCASFTALWSGWFSSP